MTKQLRFLGFTICVYAVILVYESGILTRPEASSSRLVYRPSPSVSVEDTVVHRALKRSMPAEHVTSEQLEYVRILRGGFRSTAGFLTIGLSSVPRTGASYLIDTLESLFSRLTEPQKAEVVVVLFLGSQDSSWINKTLEDLDSRFKKEMQSLLLQVIQPLPHIYPNFSSVTKRNFGDDLERVRWRTKQNVDFAHLFYHCRNISKYYIQIEDDVLVASDFINDIKTFVGKQDSKNAIWFTIEFSTLGFIGKMFHSRDLPIIKEYLLMFKEEQPCDMLINHLKRVMVQPKDIRSYVSLFQHVGKISSLNNKTQRLTDRRFKDSKTFKQKKSIYIQNLGQKRLAPKTRYQKHLTKPNPEAKITTTMETYKDYKPENAYQKESTFFWGKDPRNGDYVEIKLTKLTNITGIVIQTGHPRLFTDTLESGQIRLAHDFNEDNDCNVDEDYSSDFSGSLNIRFPRPRPIVCAVIVVKKDQKSWLVISEIELRTT